MINTQKGFVGYGKGKVAEEFICPTNEYLGVRKISLQLSR